MDEHHWTAQEGDSQEWLQDGNLSYPAGKVWSAALFAEVKVRNPHCLAMTLKTHWSEVTFRSPEPPSILRRAFFIADPVVNRCRISESSIPSSRFKSKPRTNTCTSPNSPDYHRHQYSFTV
jgi:hypothetical protein